MTPNERKTMEAVIALAEAVNFLSGNSSDDYGVRTHRSILQAALDADRAPRECDPYAKIGGFQPADPVQLAAAARPNSMPPGWIAGLPRAVVRDLTATQQYDADPPQKPAKAHYDTDAPPETYLRPAIDSVIERVSYVIRNRPTDEELTTAFHQFAQAIRDASGEPGRETSEAPK